MEELTQQNLLLGLQVEELRSREDPLEVSFTPLWAGGGGEWFCCLRRWTRGVQGGQGGQMSCVGEQNKPRVLNQQTPRSITKEEEESWWAKISSSPTK